MVTVVRATQLELNAAVQALRDGELVAFPTETVYGLGAHAGHPGALSRIFQLKGRPQTHPLIVHLDSPRFLTRWVREVPVAAERLAERFWPGPLTLVLPRAPKVHPLVTGEQDTIAVRVPSHPMAQQLLTAFGGGIAAPSANRYGRLSPTRAEHVREEFGSAVRVILDGGECKVGLESTIVACVGGSVRLLRPGAISLSQLRRVVPEVRSDVASPAGSGDAAPGIPRVPGSHGAHYAPTTPMSIVAPDDIERLAASLSEGGQRIAVLAQRPPLGTYRSVTWINAGPRVDAYAHDLYNNLRTLDKAGCARILVQAVPNDERWEAVRDRLARGAAAASIAVATEDEHSIAAGILP
jgi:L-threonylcarbamoyladenylate synthase